MEVALLFVCTGAVPTFVCIHLKYYGKNNTFTFLYKIYKDLQSDVTHKKGGHQLSVMGVFGCRRSVSVGVFGVKEK